MSLFKRGNIWWAYLFRNGVRHQYSTGTPNRRKAEKIETKLKEELNDARFQIVEADPYLRYDVLSARFLASGTSRPQSNASSRFSGRVPRTSSKCADVFSWHEVALDAVTPVCQLRVADLPLLLRWRTGER